MNIYFSMSSQLWIKFNINDIEKYLIQDVNIDNSNNITYSELVDLISHYTKLHILN